MDVRALGTAVKTALPEAAEIDFVVTHEALAGGKVRSTVLDRAANREGWPVSLSRTTSPVVPTGGQPPHGTTRFEYAEGGDIAGSRDEFLERIRTALSTEHPVDHPDLHAPTSNRTIELVRASDWQRNNIGRDLASYNPGLVFNVPADGTGGAGDAFRAVDDLVAASRMQVKSDGVPGILDRIQDAL